MQASETLGVLKKIMVEHQLVPEAGLVLTGETRLIEDLKLDSISMLELITAIEEEFDILIDFEELSLDVLNVAGSLSGLVEQKIAASQAA